jgi:hypothetical protein
MFLFGVLLFLEIFVLKINVQRAVGARPDKELIQDFTQNVHTMTENVILNWEP